MTNEARRWLEQGMAAVQAGDRAGAEPMLLEAARLDPTNPEVWLWLGWVAATPEEAVERVGRAMTLAPHDLRVQKAYAWAQGRLEQATGRAAPPPPPPGPPPLETMSPTRLEDVPLDPAVAFQRGCALLDDNEPARAVPFLEAAVQRADLNAGYHAQLAVAYYRTGRVDEAIEELQRATRLRADFDEAYYSLGLIYAERGQKEKAIAAFQRCLNLNPRHAEARRDLGVLMKQQEEQVYQEVVGTREPPPAGVPAPTARPTEPLEVKVVREPLRRSPLPSVIAVLWGLWTALYGLPLLCIVTVVTLMPDLLSQEMQRRGAGSPAMSGTLAQLVLLSSLLVYGLPMLVGILFVVGNLRRWPWVFYGNIVAAVLIMAWDLCGVVTPLGSGQLTPVSNALPAILAVSVCVALPPIAVIALSFLARDDFRRQTVTMVAPEEQLRTGDAIDYYNRGLRRSKQGKLEAAIADWEMAVHLDPRDVSFRNVLALGYAEQGRFAEAVEQLQAALQIKPNDPTTLDNIQLVRDLQTQQGR